MLKEAFCAMLVLLSFAATAQQSKQLTLYAYEQQVIPGAQKAKNLDNEESSTGTEAKYNYFFYAVSSSAARLYPVELWVKGKKYGVRFQTVPSPVTFTDGHLPGKPKTTVLVPKTGNKVLQLIPTDVIAGKKYPTAEQLAEHNAVVFVFKQGGTFYYQTMPELMKLDAAALQ